MKTKTRTVIIVCGVTLCFIIMFGMILIIRDLTGIIETSTKHIIAETVIVKQEGHELDGELEDTRKEANALIDADPPTKDEAVEVIRRAYCNACHLGRER